MTSRIRLTYARAEPFRYTGHLDFQRSWERTLRRSRLPVAYSQGFNPQVRLHLACALPLGLTSQYDLMDFWLDSTLPLAEIGTALEKALPPGIELLKIEEIDSKAPVLQNQVASSDYEITLLDAIPQPDLEGRVEVLLSAPTLPREWREKPYDLRPLVESLDCLPPDEHGRARLSTRLSAREGATGRPEELLTALGLDPTAARIKRTLLVMKN
jgi:radical SAM-linked protein